MATENLKRELTAILRAYIKGFFTIKNVISVLCFIFIVCFFINAFGDSREEKTLPFIPILLFSDNEGEVDCSIARLSELVDNKLALLDLEDVDTSYNEHLLRDSWTGERANCESPAPDSIWVEGPWIKKREPCVNYSCMLWDETNFGTGFGALKYGIMTLETMRVQNISETANGWDVIIELGLNDANTSLFIPLRVYYDLDMECLNEINVAVPGSIQADTISIWIGITDGAVTVTAVDINDLYIYTEPSGVESIDVLISDYTSWLSDWMERDTEEFFGLMAKDLVEQAYEDYVAECH